MCQEGHCGSTNGVCTLDVEVHETAEELEKEAAAPSAIASPQDAADAVAAWVKNQAQKSGISTQVQAQTVAKAVARAAEKAAKGSWLRKDQIEYATQAAAMKAAIECVFHQRRQRSSPPLFFIKMPLLWVPLGKKLLIAMHSLRVKTTATA